MNLKPFPLGLIVSIVFFLSACSADVNGVPEPRSYAQDQVELGRQLIASYGCGACHRIPGVRGADAMAGPPLDLFYKRTYIAGRLANTEDNLALWIQNPQQIDPGNAMPDLGVTEDEARDMAAYLYQYHRPSFSDLLRR